MRPKRARVACTRRWHWSRAVMSVGTASDSLPAARSFARTSSRNACVRAASTTRAPSRPAPYASSCPRPGPTPEMITTLSRSSTQRLPRKPAPGLCPHPAGQVHVLDLREDDAHGLPDPDRAGVDLVDRPLGRPDQVADQTQRRVLVELDRDHVVGGELRVGRQERRVRQHERPDAPAPREPHPLVRDRPALRAHGPRGDAHAAAGRALLHQQLSARGALPEGPGVLVVGLGEDPARFHGYLRSSTALVGTPSPLVTRQVAASFTCEVEVPRSWRTPSSTRLKPCTYASDMLPPDVLVGRRPSGHSSAPRSVNAAPSPRLQNP